MIGFFGNAPCADCGVVTKVSDPDELAICETCAESRRADEARLADQSQAGAQHIGRQRGTRDAPAPVAQLLSQLMSSGTRYKGRAVRVSCAKGYAIGKIKGKPKNGRVPVEIVDPRESGWPVGYGAHFLPGDLKPHD